MIAWFRTLRSSAARGGRPPHPRRASRTTRRRGCDPRPPWRATGTRAPPTLPPAPSWCYDPRPPWGADRHPQEPAVTAPIDWLRSSADLGGDRHVTASMDRALALWVSRPPLGGDRNPSPLDQPGAPTDVAILGRPGSTATGSGGRSPAPRTRRCDPRPPWGGRPPPRQPPALVQEDTGVAILGRPGRAIATWRSAGTRRPARGCDPRPPRRMTATDVQCSWSGYPLRVATIGLTEYDHSARSISRPSNFQSSKSITTLRQPPDGSGSAGVLVRRCSAICMIMQGARCLVGGGRGRSIGTGHRQLQVHGQH